MLNIDIMMIFFMRKNIYPNIQNPQLLGFAKLWLHRGGAIVTSEVILLSSETLQVLNCYLVNWNVTNLHRWNCGTIVTNTCWSKFWWKIHERSMKFHEKPLKYPQTIMKYPWKIHKKSWSNKQYNKNEVKENTELECHLWAKNIGGPSKRDEIAALPTLVKGPRKWNQKKWLATIVGQIFWNQSKRDEKTSLLILGQKNWEA